MNSTSNFSTLKVHPRLHDCECYDLFCLSAWDGNQEAVFFVFFSELVPLFKKIFILVKNVCSSANVD